MTARLPTCHWPEPGEVAAEEVFDQLARGGVGQGLAFVRPILELDEALRVGAFGVEAAELGEFLHGALRIERPEARLEHFHG